jgi:predicted aspartyl protease
MGTFQVEVEIGDPQGERWERVSATVGTQATFLVAPRSLLERMGVTPYRRATFRLPDDSIVEGDLGHTWVRIGDRAEIAIVVFDNESDQVILGHNTLLGLRLEPDVESQQLANATSLRLKRQTLQVA